MAPTAKELRIAEALHVLVDEIIAPTLAIIADPQKATEIVQADFTVPQSAKILSVSPRTVKRLIERGELTAKKVGGAWRIDPQDLDKYRAKKK